MDALELSHQSQSHAWHSDRVGRHPLVLFINLDRDATRRQLIQAQLEQVGLAGERIAAVDGLNLPAGLDRYFAHSVLGRPPLVSPGAIGCYASHIQAYRQIIAADAESALILEDDAVLDEHLKNILDEVLTALPDGWDMVHLSGTPRHAFKPLMTLASGTTIVRYSRVPFNTAGYLISRAGAAKMLNGAILRFWPIDTDTRRPWIFGMNTYGTVPPLIGQNRQLPTTNARLGLAPRRGLPRTTAYSWTNTPLHTLQGFFFNVRQLGLAWWLRCYVVNCGLKIRRAIAKLPRNKKRAERQVVPQLPSADPYAS